jgi:hypothetical protein
MPRLPVAGTFQIRFKAACNSLNTAVAVAIKVPIPITVAIIPDRVLLASSASLVRLPRCPDRRVSQFRQTRHLPPLPDRRRTRRLRSLSRASVQGRTSRRRQWRRRWSGRDRRASYKPFSCLSWPIAAETSDNSRCAKARRVGVRMIRLTRMARLCVALRQHLASSGAYQLNTACVRSVALLRFVLRH